MVSVIGERPRRVDEFYGWSHAMHSPGHRPLPWRSCLLSHISVHLLLYSRCTACNNGIILIDCNKAGIFHEYI